MVPEDVIDLEAGEDGPPAKKAKIEGREFRGKTQASVMDTDVQEGTGMAYERISGEALPFPPRPSTRLRSARGGRAIDPKARRSNDLEPPPIATKLPPPKTVADFSPWTGNHAEDMLNESVIKLGHFDKPPPANQSESNTAKATLWNNLSQRNSFGLQTLSHLYVQVMEKRQALGRCTAPSTFKPPPRVTVTDTKREAWLRDLANPEMPLRRQSRTIPHGIRGKLLMEQCLSKKIPLRRAVWLAKCVGANELRAFRRKGISGAAVASGEQKWIREWTIQLEQFLEGIITACGQPVWHVKVNYAIRLATYFYMELLVDAEHYLNWIVSSFRNASLDRVPAWAVVVQMYWKDIVSYRRRGRRLAEGVLSHLQEVTQKGSGAFTLLQQRLQKLIAVLAVTSRGSLILPRVWDKYEALLANYAARGADPGLINSLQHLRRRNQRLVAPLRQTPDKARSPLLELISTLDMVDLDLDIEKLAQTCTSIIPHTTSLVKALLDWASTVYRQGNARIYLAARLITRMKQDGGDTDSGVLQYLTTAAGATSRISNVYELIAELVRLDSFSVGRYLQWLITSGAIASGKHDGVDVGLLHALPPDHLATSVANTRRTLLLRMGTPADQQGEAEEVMQAFDAAVMGFTERLVQLETALSEFQSSVTKQEVCSRVIRRVGAGGVPSLALFCVARTALEHLEALPALSTLLFKSLPSDDAAVLSSISDTTNRQAHTLAVRGNLQPLVESLSDRYRVLRANQPLDRTLILSLTSLLSRMPNKIAMAKLLTDDLAICEQQNSQAACSPASDSLVSMQAGQNLDSDDEIDRVFASGNIMDEHLMQRMFCSIVAKGSKHLSGGMKTGEASSRVCRWLQQLRAVDAIFFQGLVKAYVANTVSLIGKTDSRVGWEGVGALIASDCLTLRAVVRSLDVKISAYAAASALKLVTGPAYDFGLSAMEEYRFQLQQNRYCMEHPEQVAKLIGVACTGGGFDPTQPAIVDLLMQYSITVPGVSLKTSQQLAQSPILRANSQKIVNAILGTRESTAASTAPVTTAEQVVSLATELSLPYCIDAFCYLRASGEEAQDITSLKESLLDAISRGSSVWPQLLEGVEPHVQAGLHEWAKEHLLASVVKEDATQQQQQEKLARYTGVLDVTAATTTARDNDQTITAVAEKLTALGKALSTTTTSASSDQQAVAHRTSISTLLHLSNLHILPAQHKPETQSWAPTSHSSRCNLLTALTSLLLHPALQTQQNATLLEHLSDVTAALSDTLPDEAIAAVGKHINTLHPSTDARIAFLFGESTQTPSIDAWLALTSRVAPPTTPGSGTQQQQQQPQRPPNRLTPSVTPGSSALPHQQHQHQALARIPPQGQTQLQGQTGGVVRGAATAAAVQPVDVKNTPFPLRRWEIMSDPTPVMGENDGSLSLGLFGARKI